MAGSEEALRAQVAEQAEEIQRLRDALEAASEAPPMPLGPPPHPTTCGRRRSGESDAAQEAVPPTAKHAAANYTTMRMLKARIGELQRVSDDIEAALDQRLVAAAQTAPARAVGLRCGAGAALVSSAAPSPYEDEAVGRIETDMTTVGCYPDPVVVGHPVQVVIITRTADGVPCRGASPRDFDVSPMGDVRDVTAVTGARCCFTLAFTPAARGRCGVRVHYRGQHFGGSVSSVDGEGGWDPQQTSIMLSPNPVQAGEKVTGTVLTKNAQGLLTRAPAVESLSLHVQKNLVAVVHGARTAQVSPPRSKPTRVAHAAGGDVAGCHTDGGSGDVTLVLRPVKHAPSQVRFEFVPTAVGRCLLALQQAGAPPGGVKTAGVEVVSIATPPIDTMHTVVSCSPNPVRIEDEVTVLLTTRSGAGIPTGGATTADLKRLRPVRGASALQPFRQISPSTFRTTFTAAQRGSAGLAVSFMGMTLYATTRVVGWDDEGAMVPDETSVACLSPHPLRVGRPVDLLLTTRDRWGAPAPMGAEDNWSLTTTSPRVDVVVMEKIGCCTMRAQVLPRAEEQLTLLLLHAHAVVGSLRLDVRAAQPYAPHRTQLLLLRQAYCFDNPQLHHHLHLDRLPPADNVTPLSSAVLIIAFRAEDDTPAPAPPPDAIDIRNVAASALTRISANSYQCVVSGFMSPSTVISVAVPDPPVSPALPTPTSTSLITKTVAVRPYAPTPAPERTRARCLPSAVLAGDPASVMISFFNEYHTPAVAPDPSEIALEPIGAISDLTRIAPPPVAGDAPGDARVCTLEVMFVCEKPGRAGLVVRYGGHAWEATTTVCSVDSPASGPFCPTATDLALSPHPVRPYGTVQCVITARDERYAPVDTSLSLDAGKPAYDIVLKPYTNVLGIGKKVRAVPGTRSTWVATFTAGGEIGPTGITVVVNGVPVTAVTQVQEEELDAMDEELQRLKELTNRLRDDAERDAAVLHNQQQIARHPLLRANEADALTQMQEGGLALETTSSEGTLDSRPAQPPTAESRPRAGAAAAGAPAGSRSGGAAGTNPAQLRAHREELVAAIASAATESARPSRGVCKAKVRDRLRESRRTQVVSERPARALAQHVTALWRDKTREGVTILDELAQNFVAYDGDPADGKPQADAVPPRVATLARLRAVGESIVARVRTDSVYRKHAVVSLVALALYTMSGKDIDGVMGFPDDEGAPSDDGRDDTVRNPAMFRTINAALREACTRLTDASPPGPEDSEHGEWPWTDLRRWVKTIVLLAALCDASGSYEVMRGLAGLPESVVADHAKLCPGRAAGEGGGLVWPAVSSCTLDPAVSEAYLTGQAVNATTTGGTLARNAVLFDVWTPKGLPLRSLSKYPEEHEILLSPFTALAVTDIGDTHMPQPGAAQPAATTSVLTIRATAGAQGFLQPLYGAALAEVGDVSGSIGMQIRQWATVQGSGDTQAADVAADTAAGPARRTGRDAIAAEQIHELDEARQRQVASRAERRASRVMFPYFGLELTDHITFAGRHGHGPRLEYAGCKIVASKGAASRAGLLPDERIVQVQGKHVQFLSEFKDLVRDCSPGIPVEMIVKSKYNETRTVRIAPAKTHIPTDRLSKYSRKVRTASPRAEPPDVPVQVHALLRDDMMLSDDEDTFDANQLSQGAVSVANDSQGHMGWCVGYMREADAM